jgi:hypothetical protein
MSIAALSQELTELRRLSSFEWDLVTMQQPTRENVSMSCEDLDAFREQIIQSQRDSPLADAVAEQAF